MPASRKTYPLSASPLYKLRSRRRLAELLKISNRDLKRLCQGDCLYKEWDFPKKTGGVRHVENPARPLKLAQARLARLLSRIAPPDYLYCPVKGRCYVSNASRHMGNRVIRSLDIKNFFPNTTSRRVYWFFHNRLLCEKDIAGLLTQLSTFREHLPTGSPLSPILAYFAHIDMWESIARICQAKNFTLTIYIDDCTISGEKVSDSDIWEIKQQIHRAGLRYHKEKAFFNGRGEITGAIVDGKRLVPPNRQLLKLREAKRALPSADEQGQVELRNRISGLKGQIRQIASLNERETSKSARAPS